MTMTLLWYARVEGIDGTVDAYNKQVRKKTGTLLLWLIKRSMIPNKNREELQENVEYQCPVFIQPTCHEPCLSVGTSTAVDGV